MNAKDIKKLVPDWKIKDINKALKKLDGSIDLNKAFENRQGLEFFKLWYEVFHANSANNNK